MNMKNEKKKFIESIKLYLRKNDLDCDTHFFRISEWKERGEEFLVDSEFVITSEGGLYSILNYGDSDEFYDLVQSFGYYMEMGHSWSYGFYFDENFDGAISPNELTYSEKLRDLRWIEKR